MTSDNVVAQVGKVAMSALGRIERLEARIEALTEERDAAVAQAASLERIMADTEAAFTAEGERRATAAIVAYGRDVYLQNDVLEQFLNEVERGDHLNPLDT